MVMIGDIMISTFVVAIITFIAFMWFRNEWVFKKRIAQLDISLEEYNKLVSYNEMMYEFWVWDIEKFKKSLGDAE